MNSLDTVIKAVDSRNRTRRFVPAERLAARQRFHFLVWTAFPFLAIVGWFVVQPQLSVIDIVLLLAMWTLTGCLGISVGFHRYYTHRSFNAHPALQIAMAAAGSMAAQGPLTYWVTVHRCHHQHSDDEEDPHSPQPLNKQAPLLRRIAAFLHGHMGWVLHHDVPIPLIYARDLRNNRIVRFFDRTYWAWTIFGVVLPGTLMLPIEPSIHAFLRGCIFGGLLRILVGNQIIWAINSVCHTHGDRTFETRDDSANNWLLALPAFGEGWHNNHHAFPWSARFGLKWWQLDVGWWAIRLFHLVGLASQPKCPTPTQIRGMAINVGQSGSASAPDDSRTIHVVDSAILPH